MAATGVKITEEKRVTGSYLKMIALITMLIDHIGATLIWRLYECSNRVSFYGNGIIFVDTKVPQGTFRDNLLIWLANNQELVYTVYEYIRIVGRLAFPIYCFLLVEGFRHTRSVKKYALRLLIFAFISEIPFDLALSGEWFNPYSNNVFFTLLLGLLLIWGVSYVEKFHEFWQEKKWDDFLGKMLCTVVSLMLVIPMALLAELVLNCDYGMAGIFAIYVMYLFRQVKELGYSLAVLLLSILSSNTEIVALIMLIPLLRYNGERGKGNKYLFYAFYPAHLLILGILCSMFGV